MKQNTLNKFWSEQKIVELLLYSAIPFIIELLFHVSHFACAEDIPEW